jgi:hypothetical protein
LPPRPNRICAGRFADRLDYLAARAACGPPIRKRTRNGWMYCCEKSDGNVEVPRNGLHSGPTLVAYWLMTTQMSQRTPLTSPSRR